MNNTLKIGITKIEDAVLRMGEKYEEQRKGTLDAMIKGYIETCENFMNNNPTREMLKENTGLSENIWKHNMANLKFLYLLYSELKSKKNQAKSEEKESLWMEAASVITKKMSYIDFGKERRNISIDDMNESFLSNDMDECLSCGDKIPKSQTLCDTCAGG